MTASRSSPGAGATRRETAASGAVLLAGAILGEPLPAFASAADDEPRVTHRVFLDVGVCPTIVRADRALGAGGALCADAEPLGRVEIGLFGDLVPNVVFGRVLRGLETVNAVARTPTFKPSGNSVAWNQVAEWVGDERAGKARESWSKPTKAIVITNAGVLE